ncbi:hypothetical protein C8Q77DRAFT_1127140 [Trametes polyzona]|nr:hypothetical protein C8Q77DRAFT_1127140 [Trametes polyzona]
MHRLNIAPETMYRERGRASPMVSTTYMWYKEAKRGPAGEGNPRATQLHPRPSSPLVPPGTDIEQRYHARILRCHLQGSVRSRHGPGGRERLCAPCRSGSRTRR